MGPDGPQGPSGPPGPAGSAGTTLVTRHFEFTIPGLSTLAIPAGAKFAKVFLVGGGAGGLSRQTDAHGGGGAGAIFEAIVPTFSNLSTVMTILVGAGGPNGTMGQPSAITYGNFQYFAQPGGVFVNTTGGGTFLNGAGSPNLTPQSTWSVGNLDVFDIYPFAISGAPGDDTQAIHNRAGSVLTSTGGSSDATFMSVGGGASAFAAGAEGVMDIPINGNFPGSGGSAAEAIAGGDTTGGNGYAAITFYFY